jgi:hypothetical protein
VVRLSATFSESPLEWGRPKTPSVHVTPVAGDLSGTDVAPLGTDSVRTRWSQA